MRERARWSMKIHKLFKIHRSSFYSTETIKKISDDSENGALISLRLASVAHSWIILYSKVLDLYALEKLCNLEYVAQPEISQVCWF